MKTLLYLFFVLALTSTSLAQYPLVDTSGEPILNNAGGYFIFPVTQPGAAVQLAETGSETCPRTVVLGVFQGVFAIPVRFSSPLLIFQIDEGMPVHVDFLRIPYPCLPSPARWKVDEDDGNVKIVNEGEPTGFVGSFRIEGVSEQAFKLQYCGTQDECKDIGVSNDSTRSLTVKDGEPLIVRFVKTHDSQGIRMTI